MKSDFQRFFPKNYLQLFLLLFIQMGIVVALVTFFQKEMKRGETGSDYYSQGGINTLAIMILWVIAAVKEEIKYRLFLGQFVMNNFSLSISFIITDLIVSLLYFGIDSNSGDNYHFVYYALVFIFSGIAFIFINPRLAKLPNIESVMVGHKWHIFIASSLLFSAWHIITWKLYLNGIFYFLMYFFNGLIFSYVRVKFNFITVIGYHMLYNLPFITIYLIH